MKVRMNLKINNCDKFIDEVIEKYHFDRKNKPELTEIYNNLMDCVKPLAAYKINQKVTGIKIIDDCQAAVVCMTMGKGPDILKEAYTKNKELDKAYMMDCIANELLMKMYVEFNNMYARFHRRYVKRYVFIGDEITTEMIPDIIEDIKGNASYNVEIGSIDVPGEEYIKDDFIASANKYGVMEPTKSVVFYALLTENPNQVCEGICDNCNNKNCENNPLYVEETDEE